MMTAPLSPPLVAVHAFHPDTVAEVRQTRAEIDAAWKRMQDYW